jgi:hypothetical protein
MCPGISAVGTSLAVRRSEIDHEHTFGEDIPAAVHPRSRIDGSCGAENPTHSYKEQYYDGHKNPLLPGPRRSGRPDDTGRQRRFRRSRGRRPAAGRVQGLDPGSLRRAARKRSPARAGPSLPALVNLTQLLPGVGSDDCSWARPLRHPIAFGPALTSECAVDIAS